MSVEILHGDVIDVLRTLPPDHFDCVVTSPPYWGLRDYGVEGQIGMEPTLVQHLTVMVEVMAQVHRVLKPTGTCWLNYGDCYATTPNGRSAAAAKTAGGDDRIFRDKPFSTIQSALKPKDLCLLPNRLAIALQDWGWWVRSEIIWGKPNPMPESIRDRPATAHEKIWLLTKSARYHYDAEAVRRPPVSGGCYNMPAGRDTDPGVPGIADGSPHRQGRRIASDKQRGHGRRHAGFNARWDGMSRADQQARGRNLRNYEPAPVEVWEMATRPFSEAHFATFPPELVQRCLSAGCPPGGRVLDPFGGSGTTAVVADRCQMNCTLIEINPDYIEIARRRLARDQGPLLAMAEGSA